MPVKTITTNKDENMGIDARSDVGYRTLSYDGSLGGGTLQLLTAMEDGTLVAVPDSKLSAAKLDDNGDVIKQVAFTASGNVWVRLSGATAPNVKVSVI